jgi:hypothetical protein
MTAKISLPGKLKVHNADDKEVAIIGYTGTKVDLRDYGFPEPLVYDMDGFSVATHIPYTHEHDELIGHTVSSTIQNGQLTNIAKHAVESELSTKVYSEIVKGEPYEASMDAEILLDDVVYIDEGTVEVNNKVFSAPIFVAQRGRVTGITATKAGRDSNTRITKLSQEHKEGKELLMKVKNSRTNSDPDLGYLNDYTDHPQGKALIENARKEKWSEQKFLRELVKNSAPPADPPTDKSDDPVSLDYLFDYIDDSDAKELIANARKEKWEEATFTKKLVEVKNAKKAPVIRDFDYLFDYIGDEDAKALIPNARKEKWTEEKFKDQLQLVKTKNSYPPLPGHIDVNNKEKGEATFTARLAMSLGLSEEKIAKKCGERALDEAGAQGMMGPREALMICANANGGRYTGHSDVKNMAGHVKKLVKNSAFSTLDYPNLMNRVNQWILEERWEMQEPQFLDLCKEEVSGNFRPQTHLKPKGGKMWEGMNDEGKITHATFGGEDTYTTELRNKAQIITFPYEQIVNDDIGWIQDAVEQMVEGALMLPDYQGVNLVYNAGTGNVLETDVSLHTLALTEANLTTVYNAVRRQTISKAAAASANKTVNQRFETRWWLVTTLSLEQTAWDIIKQDRIVSNTTANTKQGDKNYWFNRLDLMTLDNLDNTTFNANADVDCWMLVPQTPKYRPFYVRYLNQMKRPVTETVELAEDMLGFGVRGWWPINLGYRPMEGNKLQAFARSIPA